MKLKLRCAHKLVACGAALFALALALATDLSAQTAKQGKATVTALKGHARFTTDNRTWQMIRVGTVIKPGSVIQTAANSHVDIVLGDRAPVAAAEPLVGTLVVVPGTEEEANVVRITPDSILAIDKLTAEDTGTDMVTETQLDLRAGRITGNVKKLSAASRYEIKFPTGVAGIRGTLYSITSAGIVQVGLGSVVVSYLKDGAVVTQVVVAGQQFDPATGLVSPIPNFNLPTFLRDIPKPPRTRGTSFVEDHTIYYVSPITGGRAFGS